MNRSVFGGKILRKKNIILGIFLIGIIIALCGCSFEFNIGNIDKTTDKDTVVNQQNEIEYNKDELLPLGTLVLLKDTNRQLIITGRMQKLAADPSGEIWDYSGCAYPRGFMSNNDSYAFNADQIEKVYFRGYEDEDEIKYNKQLIDYRNKIRGTETISSENSNINVESKDKIENIPYSEDEILPLGSIITFEGSNKKLMIIGRVESLEGGDSNKIYDYAACIYPEGNISSDTNYLFNGDTIEKVYFRGYEDNQEIEYRKQIIKYKESLKK